MAGDMAIVPSKQPDNPASGIASSPGRDLYLISFARFITYPSLPSTCPSLVPLPHNRRSRPTTGTWISTQSSTATLLLQPLHLHTAPDAILSVHFSGKIFEEHYVSKLQFLWPHVSCIPGYPSRGIRTVFARYKDSAGEIQKFAMRFSTISESEMFVNAMKDILKDRTELEPLNSEFQSEISSQSVFRSTTRHPSRNCLEDSSIMDPANDYSPQMPLRLNYDVEQVSHTKELTSLEEPNVMASFNTYSPQLPLRLNDDVEQEFNTKKPAESNILDDISPNFPPSFTSLLNNCCTDVSKVSTQSNLFESEDIVLKSKIMRFLDDSTFHDMLIKVEKVISEIGGDLM